MKTISGINTSSKPHSLSKSASVLHKFINEDPGASQAVSVYLKRASAAFDELVQFHYELKGSCRKHKKSRMEMVDNRALTDAETNHVEEDEPATKQGQFIDSLKKQSYGYTRYRVRPEGGGFDREGNNSHRKMKKKQDFGDFGPEAGVRIGVRIVEEMKRKK
ncbi:uncharacterized protein LOC122650029 [Telopea speciosissima]|uniref:uncharacterized protein LOC122650029 n=1 Tax=Telopea speciosissima TaxID=54955 RepID=UPI001CC5334D|nr:uncharacterized protein LOC122650029 [Telopea speciosissima]